MEYKVRFERKSPYAILPTKGSDKAAGYDLYLAENVTLHPGEYKMVSTGWNVQPPPGTEIQVRPRSGLAGKQGVTVLNTPGTIDEDYRGVLKVVLINHSQSIYVGCVGHRVAQMVVKPVIYAEVEEVESLATSSRGDSGFGSTGS